MISGKFVVYGAIFGGKDAYKPPPKGDYDVVLFTDDPKIKAPGHVRVVQVPLLGDPRRMSRRYKMLSHVFFPEAEYTLWMDGSIEARGVDIRKTVGGYLANADLAAFRHPLRKCTYEEALACIEFKLEDPDLIRRQVDHYRAQGLKPDIGLVETGVLFRRHTDKVREFNEAWHKELQTFSNRDQLSFYFTVQNSGVRFFQIPESICRGSGPPGFYVGGHSIGNEWKPQAPKPASPPPKPKERTVTLLESIASSLEPDVWNNRWSQVKRFGAGMAVEYEIGLLLGSLVRCLKPETVIETGTHRGFATAMMAQGLKDNGSGILHTIDVTDYGVVQDLAQFGLDRWFRFYKGDSADMLGTLSKTIQKVDFLFLDADHKAASVLRELEAAMPMIKSGTYIAFHDTIIDQEENQAVQEIRKRHFQWERIRIVSARGFDLVRIP